MLRVIVLGSAAGGGVPQWNCGCAVCAEARSGNIRDLTQASVAITVDNENWFLINAAPDLRQQLNATSALHPRHLRDSPLAGIILTNGEIDAIAGLLSLRERAPFTIYAHQNVLDTLKENTIFNVLRENVVQRQPIAINKVFQPSMPDGGQAALEILPFAAPGKVALYLEDGSHVLGEEEGNTLGLQIRDPTTRKFIVFLAACAVVTADVKKYLKGASMVLFDGTVWQDDELIIAGLGNKTGRSMGHIAMSGDQGVIASLSDLDIERKIFLHINNSNPALLPDSPERKFIEHTGWEIASDGMEIVL